MTLVYFLVSVNCKWLTDKAKTKKVADKDRKGRRSVKVISHIFKSLGMVNIGKQSEKELFD